MQSLAVAQSFLSDSREPIVFELTTPFTSRVPVITGTCEKSLVSINVTTCCNVLSGLTETGGEFADARRPMR